MCVTITVVRKCPNCGQEQGTAVTDGPDGKPKIVWHCKYCGSEGDS